MRLAASLSLGAHVRCTSPPHSVPSPGAMLCSVASNAGYLNDVACAYINFRLRRCRRHVKPKPCFDHGGGARVPDPYSAAARACQILNFSVKANRQGWFRVGICWGNPPPHISCLPHCNPYRIWEDFSLGGARTLFGRAHDCISLLVYFLLLLCDDLRWWIILVSLDIYGMEQCVPLCTSQLRRGRFSKTCPNSLGSIVATCFPA